MWLVANSKTVIHTHTWESCALVEKDTTDTSEDSSCMDIPTHGLISFALKGNHSINNKFWNNVDTVITHDP